MNNHDNRVTPCYCINLRRASNRVTELYDQKLRAFNISINHFSILAQMHEMSGCGIGELAEQLQLDKSTLARTIQPLIKAGYIENTAPEGVRPARLRLTPRGEDMLRDARPAWREAQQEVRASLKTDVQELMGLLAELG